MKYLLFALLLVGCSSKSDTFIDANIEKKIFTYFAEKIKSVDSSITLDSARFVSLDTLTTADVYFIKQGLVMDESEQVRDEIETLQSDAKHLIQMLRLTNDLRGYGSGNTLYTNYKEDLDSKMKEMRDLISKDSLNMLEVTKYDSLIKVSDSVKAVYYEAKCLIQYKRKDMTVKRDTGFVILDLQKNIINKEDIKP